MPLFCLWPRRSGSRVPQPRLCSAVPRPSGFHRHAHVDLDKLGRGGCTDRGVCTPAMAFIHVLLPVCATSNSSNSLRRVPSCPRIKYTQIPTDTLQTHFVCVKSKREPSPRSFCVTPPTCHDYLTSAGSHDLILHDHMT